MKNCNSQVGAVPVGLLRTCPVVQPAHWRFVSGRMEAVIRNIHAQDAHQPPASQPVNQGHLSTVAGTRHRLHSQGRCHGAPGELISDWCSFPATPGTPFAKESVRATSRHAARKDFQVGRETRASIGGRSHWSENNLPPNSNFSSDFSHLILKMNTYLCQTRENLKCF